MIIYSQTQNVYEAAKERIHKLYDTGRPVSVGFSGGKDSTVLLEITLEVAKERGIKKVPVCFLDQEAEYTQTVEYMRYTMTRPEVEPYWFQIPFKLWNASAGEWFIPWEPGKEWMREKEEYSYKENIYGAERFTKLLETTVETHFGEGYIHLGGVRIEESPARRMALLNGPEKLPGMRYGSSQRKGTVIYPLFDWSYRDIWYYIFSNKVKYNKIYNQLIAKIPLIKCRVSSIIHENALGTIMSLQEYDPDLYNKLYKRIKNVGTTNHSLMEICLRYDSYPQCFKDWNEYLNYLIDNIIPENHQEKYRKHLQYVNRAIENWTEADRKEMFSTFYCSIIDEDFEFSHVANKMLILKKRYLKGKNE